MFTHRYFSVLPLVVGLFLGGCTAEASSVGGADSEVVAGDAELTVGNYASDPKIVAIRKVVKEIEASGLQAEVKNVCDGRKTKFTDADGAVRKVVTESGQGNVSVKTTIYFDAAGAAPLFVFSERFDGEIHWESRLYFGADGEALIQVIRPVQVEHPFDRLPEAHEALDAASFAIDADQLFARDCG